jgi:hypothetical protein
METIKYTIAYYSGIGECPKVILLNREKNEKYKQFDNIEELKKELENSYIYFVEDKYENRLSFCIWNKKEKEEIVFWDKLEAYINSSIDNNVYHENNCYNPVFYRKGEIITKYNRKQTYTEFIRFNFQENVYRKKSYPDDVDVDIFYNYETNTFDESEQSINNYFK